MSKEKYIDIGSMYVESGRDNDWQYHQPGALAFYRGDTGFRLYVITERVDNGYGGTEPRITAKLLVNDDGEIINPDGRKIPPVTKCGSYFKIIKQDHYLAYQARMMDTVTRTADIFMQRVK